MELLYKRFVTEWFGKDGLLNYFEPHPPKGFNFAFDVVDTLAAEKPEKLAMLWVGENGETKRFTFRDMAEQSARAANLFKNAGIKKGDIVMLVLKRHYQFWFAIMGLCKLGAVVAPATNLLMKKDLVYRFNAASVKAIVCTGESEVSDHVAEALSECPSVKSLWMVNGQKNGWADFDAGLAAASPVFPRPIGDEGTKNNDPMLLYFTSGTTGDPKMVVHDFDYPLAHIITARHWHNADPEGVHFTLAETGWGKAVWGKLYGQWLCEAAVFVYDFVKFSPADILSMIETYKITTFCAPPTVYRFMIHEGLSKYDLSSLQHCTIAGEALNPDVFNTFYEQTGIKLMEGFGQTETTLIILTQVGMEPKPGSMGKSSPAWNCDILNAETGEPAMDGEVGEIVVRLDPGKKIYGLFSNYYRDPERTERTVHGGYYHTGDLAWRDEDGYFWFVGRNDDLIKSSGYRIGPFEIESVLVEHPAVMECAVTGVPDPIRGQIVKATVVLTPEYSPSEALVKELQEHVKKVTAPYKYPRIVEFMSELPKTISGKIRRVELRENP